jgi:hypothetical protein
MVSSMKICWKVNIIFHLMSCVWNHYKNFAANSVIFSVIFTHRAYWNSWPLDFTVCTAERERMRARNHVERCIIHCDKDPEILWVRASILLEVEGGSGSGSGKFTVTGKPTKTIPGAYEIRGTVSRSGRRHRSSESSIHTSNYTNERRLQ